VAPAARMHDAVGFGSGPTVSRTVIFAAAPSDREREFGFPREKAIAEFRKPNRTASRRWLARWATAGQERRAGETDLAKGRAAGKKDRRRVATGANHPASHSSALRRGPGTPATVPRRGTRAPVSMLHRTDPRCVKTGLEANLRIMASKYLAGPPILVRILLPGCSVTARRADPARSAGIADYVPPSPGWFGSAGGGGGGGGTYRSGSRG